VAAPAVPTPRPLPLKRLGLLLAGGGAAVALSVYEIDRIVACTRTL
jgi:hypothetical protein